MSLSLFSGGFAFVYEAQDMSSGKDYALKVRWKYTFAEKILPVTACYMLRHSYILAVPLSVAH